MRRVLTELLMQLSWVSSDDAARVFVLAATNRLQDLDPALLRRFDRRLQVTSHIENPAHHGHLQELHR
jgi:SpoVK/Ycf46/Vps4 family AAA+-type ATPase